MSKGNAGRTAETTETQRIGSTYIPIDDATPASDDDQEAAFAEFAALSDQERSGINVRVYEVPHDERGQAVNNAKLVWLMCEPVDKYTKDELCKVIQRGFFDENQKIMWVRLMIYKEGERGIRRNLLFPLRAAPKAPPAEAESRGQVAEILAMVARMNAESAQRQDAFFQRLAEARTVASAPPDPMAMMRDTVALLTPLLTAATGGRAASDPMAALGGMISTMRQVKSLGDELAGKGGDGDGDSSTASVIKALVPLAKPALEIAASIASRGAAPPAAPTPPPVIAPPAPAAAAPPPQTTQTESQPVNIQEILKLQELIGRAADLDGKADPKTVADQILAEIPESMDDAIYQRLSDANWFQGLQALQPKVAGKQAFFTQVRDCILKQFAPIDDQPPK